MHHIDLRDHVLQSCGPNETRGFYCTAFLRIRGFDASLTHSSIRQLLQHVIYRFKFIITLRHNYLLYYVFTRIYFMGRQP
jgi:hypothetical protein